MDFVLDDTRLELRKVAQDFFADKSALAVVRRLEDSGHGYDAGTWRAMAALEWTRLGHAEEVGGVGGGLLDLAMLYQEMGRNLHGSPHLESAVICAGVLATAGGHGELLGHVLEGGAVVVPALMEVDGTYGPDGIRLAGDLTAAGLRLHGTKVLVPYADTAARVLVACRTAPGNGGVTLALVEPDVPGLDVTPTGNIAGVPLFAVTFDDVGVPSEGLVGAPGTGWSLLGPALDRAAVLRSAQIVGAAERLLDISVTYARSREQFGRAIGAYQAVQYLCTDIAIAAELALLATLRAAALLDLGEPAEREVAEAKARASAAARLAAERAHEVHAGFAFMMEADVQLFTRRLRHWELDLGDEDYHRGRLVDALLH